MPRNARFSRFRRLRRRDKVECLVPGLPLTYVDFAPAKTGELETMKLTFVLLCLLCASAAFGQAVLAQPSYAQLLVMADHPQHASQHELAQPQDLFEHSGYTYAKGELPLSDFVHPSEPEPLGDIARAYRKEHASVKKAEFVFEKYVAKK
jgi:hypothetical protein